MRLRAARYAVAAAVVSAATLVTGGPAHADIPDGWVPGDDGIEYDFGFTSWMHQGRYADTLGNWHTGYITVEEDDDGITGELQDWYCKGTAQPPKPGSTSTPNGRCTLKKSRWLDTIDQPVGLEMSTFKHQRNVLRVNLTVDAYDTYLGDRVGSVPINIGIRAIGAPDEVSESGSGSSLYFHESYGTTKSWGTVDGHHIDRATRTTQFSGRISFDLSEWELAP